MKLFAFLLCTVLLGWGLAETECHRNTNFALGHTRKPGPYLWSFLGLMLGLGRALKMKPGDLLLIGLAFLTPSVMEFSPTMAGWRWLVSTPVVLLGCVLVWRQRRDSSWWVTGMFLAASYLNSITIFNLICGIQVMNYFKSGWIS